MGKTGKGNNTADYVFVYDNSLELISGITSTLDLNASKDIVGDRIYIIRTTAGFPSKTCSTPPIQTVL